LLRRGTIPRWISVTLTLLPLFAVKAALSPFITLLGLSFITFRAVDAMVMSDIQDPLAPGEYFLYLFFPPAILAGPMYRWRAFRGDLAGAFERLSIPTLMEAWENLVLGIVQKFVIAQIIDICLMQRLNPEDYSFSGITLNAVGYSVFLYFDFAGYSNMAIGAAGLFGFRLPENFHNPIATRNPQDFWKRWHASLSEWLRDVVFSPLYKFLVSKGGLAAQKIQAQNICIMATLLIMGTWNGFEPRYLCSGLMFGSYSVAYNEMSHARRVNPIVKALFEKRGMQAAGRALTLVLVILALYVFSGRSPIR
jgi:membrane protein involved in D-alanine export